MKILMFSVFDKAVNAYAPPFYARSKGEAVRSFTEACNDEKSNLYKYGNDYTLMYIGDFDDQSGIVNCDSPKRIISANECTVHDVGDAVTVESLKDAVKRVS